MRAFDSAYDARELVQGDERYTDWKTILGEGDESPDVLLVKPYPHGWDAGANKPFMGKDGVTIRRVLVQQEVSFYATNLFPFFRPDAKPKKKDAEAVSKVFVEEWYRVKPKNIILFGANAARWCPIFDFPFSTFREVENRVIESNGYRFLIAPTPMQIATVPLVFKAFKQSLEQLLTEPQEAENVTLEDNQYIPVESRAQALRILRYLGDRIAIDVETTGLNPYQDKLLTVQISDKEGSGYAFPWELLSPAEWGKFLADKSFVWQNGTFDVKVLANNGLFLTIDEDTMLMHSFLNEAPGTHSMAAMARNELGIEKYSDMVDYDNMEDIPFRELAVYGARDTDITLRLANKFKPKVKDRYIYKVLHDAQNAVTRAELKGIRVDRELAQQFLEEIEGAMHDLRCRLQEQYGLENPGSYQQVAKLLYEDLGIPEQKLKGKTTTASDSIEPFMGEYPVIRDILEYRHLQKAAGTYVKRILGFTEYDGRYHPEFRLAATETGRVAEQLIMLIPRADELEDPDLGKQYQVRLRELFIPDEGHVMIGADYSGLEVGMAAYLSRDRQLIEDVNAQRDTHSLVAIRAFGLDIPEEPYETLKDRVKESHDYQRTMAKFATFTWLYGGNAGAIQRQLGISPTQAESILEALRSRYWDLASWQERLQASARHQNHVTTPWGRVRHFMFNEGMDRQIEQDMLREVINYPIQSMATDMTMAAFAEASQAGLDVLFPLHDAIYIQALKSEAEQAKKQLVEIMERQLPGPVKFRVEAKIGDSWASLG